MPPLSFFLKIVLMVAFPLFLLTSCANPDSVSEEPLRSGASMAFPGSYERVAHAATAALFDVKMPIAKMINQNDGTIIILAQHLNTITDGDVGRVFIERTANPTTSIYVVVESRLTGEHKQSFAPNYFQAVQTELNK